MSERDVIVQHTAERATGVRIVRPQVGGPTLGDLVVELDVGDAAAVTNCSAVKASLHGGLDIAEGTAPEGGRWIVEIPAALLETDFQLVIRAETDGGIIDLAEVSGRNTRFESRPDGIQALLMHQLGRAGSTMMMRLLAGHPEVAVFDDYPLEARPGLAWMHSLGVLLGAQTVPLGDEPFFDAEDVATANPYLTERFLGSEILAEQHRGGFDRLRTAFAEAVEDAYLQRRPGAAFFAEKFRIESPRAALTQQTMLSTWPDSRQIILVRDPRDLLCSRLSFNRKRLEASFDLDLTDDAVTGVPTIVHHLRLAARQLAAFPNAILVRYEDLVDRPVATATRIFRELELNHGYGTVRDAVANAVASRLDLHVTTSSASASIGRWRAELPPEAAAHLVAELSDELAVFGYDR